MKAVKTLLAGAALAVAAGGFAAPAAAQYYPYPGGYGTGNVLVGAILDSILRGGYRYNGQYYANEQVAVDQCARAAEARLNGNYGGYGGYGSYGGYRNYGYNGPIRVNQIERVERTRNGNFRVIGWAGSAGWRGNYGYYGGGYNQPYGGYNQPYGGYNAPYGGYNQPYGGYYGNAPAPEFRFNCKLNVRTGRISDLDINRQRYARYGY